MGLQKPAMAARLVGAAAEERDPAAGEAPTHFGESLASLGPAQAGAVAAAVFRPADPAAAEAAEQGQDRAELFEPDVHARATDSARPEAHDQHARAVVAARRIVDTLRDEPRAPRRRARHPRLPSRVVAVRPPSMTRTWPVTQRDSSEAR